ncbi:zinc dependent phospholipase C family protein [Clostridiaceae bacterium NSJ-31]|uniref:Zinc dependent phospholipase C family protein n=1 Tax=Ligaoa zhengdingensis TaxID=2763658 RepID=A0A926DUD5_9FIRM|nr:zinc dependent phospholipase C family protein [Ligaoa zhengdingensis]MBC8545455.1 zinc dependent phospholipase C family protein [Ligaoa zhengdingensis]
MPAYVSHSLFGEWVRAALAEPQLQRLLERNAAAFEWGLQGPDLLFFYGILPPRLDHRVNRLGSRMHREAVEPLFHAMLQLLDGACGGQEAVAAYLMGFCCHYSLDCTAHPYIYWLQEQVALELPPSDRRGLHNQLESDIDSDLYLLRTGATIDSFSVSTALLADTSVLRAIARLYQALSRQVYGAPVTEKQVMRCFGSCYRVLHLVLNRPGALVAARALDAVGFQHNRLAAHVRLAKARREVLNREEKEWRNLQTGELSTASYLVLEDLARSLAVRLIEAVWLRLCYPGEAARDALPQAFTGLPGFDFGNPARGREPHA